MAVVSVVGVIQYANSGLMKDMVRNVSIPIAKATESQQSIVPNFNSSDLFQFGKQVTLANEHFIKDNLHQFDLKFKSSTKLVSLGSFLMSLGVSIGFIAVMTKYKNAVQKYEALFEIY